jgi:hypothetical protein
MRKRGIETKNDKVLPAQGKTSGRQDPGNHNWLR